MNNMDTYKALAEKLSKAQTVNKSGQQKGEDAAWTMAHAFLDLEEAFQTYLNDLLPKLLNEELNELEITDTLLDIGEEFRHILYHIKDLNYYDYLFE